jgi:adenine-specific DNA-methyltransferase
MLEYALELQQRYENSTATAIRKHKGQVFTAIEVARFMASLFSKIPQDYQLLDPGAGIGILTAAVCEKLTKYSSPRRLIAHVFENDRRLLPFLEKNLDNCRRALRDIGHSLEYTIYADDFVLACSSNLHGQSTFDDALRNIRFDGVIMNPPYFKVRKDSDYARAMAKIVHGQPNIYAFFMALGAALLKENGELVAITPRSFCNGLYFRSFRRWFFDRVSLDHVHIFESRSHAFKAANVLQENIITKCHRVGRSSPRVHVTKSFGSDLSIKEKTVGVPVEDIIDDSHGDRLIRIPETKHDSQIISLLEALSTRFIDTGLRISTGPIVLFRTLGFVMFDTTDRTAVPLLQPHNVRSFETVWPVHKNGKPVAFRYCDESLRHLLPVKNCVLVRRFSAKEEKRRLTAACLLRTQFPYSYVGIENHLNYIYHAERELSEREVYGIAALFNSTLFDRYFRIISGNTQVNATEIRTLRFPDLQALGKIGACVKHKTCEEIDAIIFNCLKVHPSVRECLVSD